MKVADDAEGARSVAGHRAAVARQERGVVLTPLGQLVKPDRVRIWRRRREVLCEERGGRHRPGWGWLGRAALHLRSRPSRASAGLLGWGLSTRVIAVTISIVGADRTAMTEKG